MTKLVVAETGARYHATRRDGLNEDGHTLCGEFIHGTRRRLQRTEVEFLLLEENPDRVRDFEQHVCGICRFQFRYGGAEGSLNAS